MDKRVLLIDDEDDIREVAEVSLECVAHWTLIEARSGADGIARAETEQPDVILLDVMMPCMDGPTTLQQLRTNPMTQHIPVIFLTAKVQAADRRYFDELGVQGVIAKPFDPLNLAAQIAQVLGW